MIGMDTNILLRYLAQDDSGQLALANALTGALTQEQPGYVSLVALAEVAWTLHRVDGVSRETLVAHLQRLLSMSHVTFQSETAVIDALDHFEASRIDFPDCLIERIGHFDGCRVTMTFDRKASRTLGFELLTWEGIAALAACSDAAASQELP